MYMEHIKCTKNTSNMQMTYLIYTENTDPGLFGPGHSGPGLSGPGLSGPGLSGPWTFWSPEILVSDILVPGYLNSRYFIIT
jgi:hypothetical protein